MEHRLDREDHGSGEPDCAAEEGGRADHDHLASVRAAMRAILEHEGGARVDYATIADPETLVELDIEYRTRAEQGGVPLYVRVPTVSTHPAFIRGLSTMVDGFRIASELRAAEPEIMRGVTNGVLHKNTASRKFARLNKRVQALA